MGTEMIMQLVTVVVTLVLGVLAKKSTFIENKTIPIQNVAIGLVMAVIHWIMTKDLSLAITLSGLAAGGTYDLSKNIVLFLKEDR